MRVLLTGGTGYLGASIIDALLTHNHTIVFTTRTTTKGDALLSKLNNPPTSRLSYTLIPDISSPTAFSHIFPSTPPFDAVIHTASPYHFRFTNPKTEIYDPIVNGTLNLLTAIHAHAPTVRRVILTSSFAAMVNVKSPPKIYDESHWNPITLTETLETDKFSAWRGSKTLAEKAAWEFVETKRPGFSVSTICTPLMFGLLRQPVGELGEVNQSVERIRDMIGGEMRDGPLPPTGISIWADVRDVAEAHVLAMERVEAEGRRFFVTEGLYTNARIVDVIRERFPGLRGRLPEEGSYGPDVDVERPPYGFDNGMSREVLGLRYRGLEESVVDTVESMLRIGGEGK